MWWQSMNTFMYDCQRQYIVTRLGTKIGADSLGHSFASICSACSTPLPQSLVPLCVAHVIAASAQPSTATSTTRTRGGAAAPVEEIGLPDAQHTKFTSYMIVDELTPRSHVRPTSLASCRTGSLRGRGSFFCMLLCGP